MLGGQAAAGQRLIAALGKERRRAAPQSEQGGDDMELDPAIPPASPQFLPSLAPRRGLERRGRHGVAQHLPSRGEIDGTAIVGIDQTQIPELRALIDVGDAGGGQLQDRLGKGVHGTQGCDLREEAGQIRDEFPRPAAVEQAFEEAEAGLLVIGIGIEPARLLLGFPERLHEIGLHPLQEGRGRGAGNLVRREEFEGPGPDQGLIDEIFVEGTRRLALSIPQPLVEPDPAPHPSVPFLGNLRQDIQPGPAILAALGVMGRRRQHAGRPMGPALGQGAMGFRRRAGRIAPVPRPPH